VDYVGRDGVGDMEELAGRFATASTLPITLDCTEVAVIRAGLEKLGGRAVIGMSGLLVKSTVIMKQNLEELNQRELAGKYPVILGGTALTRAYVEQDLHEIYRGEVRYARDAFEGLRLMDALIGIKRGVPGAKLPGLKQRRSGRRPSRPWSARRRATSVATSPPTTRCPPRRSGAPA
jgi:cobalamin-dependent methionine synthase I